MRETHWFLKSPENSRSRNLPRPKRTPPKFFKKAEGNTCWFWRKILRDGAKEIGAISPDRSCWSHTLIKWPSWGTKNGGASRCCLPEKESAACQSNSLCRLTLPKHKPGCIAHKKRGARQPIDITGHRGLAR